MPFSSGTFSRIYNWVNEQLSSPIEISKLDAQEEDFATALNNCILRDGTGLPTAAMDWNGQNLTNVAAFTATGIVTGGRFVPTSSSVPTNGMYLPAANTVGIASNTTLRWSVNSTGTHTFATPSSGSTIVVPGLTGVAAAYIGVLGNTNNPRVEITGTEASALSEINFTGSTGSAAGRISRAGTAVIDISSARAVSIAAPSSGFAFSATGASGTSVANFAGAAADSSRVEITRGGGTPGTDSFAIIQDTSSVARLFNRANAAMDFSTNGTIRMTIAAGGGVTIASGGLTVSAGGASITGTVAATAFSGDGSALTALNATQLTSGTVPDARFPATLPALSGVNLTALNATNLASGTVNTARISGSYTGITAIGNATANDAAANAWDVGFRDMPINAQTGTTYTTVIADRGKTITMNNATHTSTIDDTLSYPVGTVLAFVNLNATSATVTCSTAANLKWEGTASTGARTVPQYSRLVAHKVAANTWIASGAIT